MRLKKTQDQKKDKISETETGTPLLTEASKPESSLLVSAEQSWDWIKGFWEKIGSTDKLTHQLKPENSYLINMELRNGMHKTFFISTKQNKFHFNEDTYIIDPELKYYNLSSKCFMFDYHQDLTIPIKRIIPVKEIQNAIKQSGLIETENSTNPSTLQHFVESKVIEGVMKGQKLDELFKKITLMIVVTMIASIIHLLIFVFKSGMLDSVSIPGL